MSFLNVSGLPPMSSQAFNGVLAMSMQKQCMLNLLFHSSFIKLQARTVSISKGQMLSSRCHVQLDDGR